MGLKEKENEKYKEEAAVIQEFNDFKAANADAFAKFGLKELPPEVQGGTAAAKVRKLGQLMVSVISDAVEKQKSNETGDKDKVQADSVKVVATEDKTVVKITETVRISPNLGMTVIEEGSFS